MSEELKCYVCGDSSIKAIAVWNIAPNIHGIRVCNICWKKMMRHLADLVKKKPIGEELQLRPQNKPEPLKLEVGKVYSDGKNRVLITHDNKWICPDRFKGLYMNVNAEGDFYTCEFDINGIAYYQSFKDLIALSPNQSREVEL